MANAPLKITGMDEEDVRKHLAQCGIEETDDASFYMHCYKVLLCPKAFSHDWGACPYAHPKENARRRDPMKHAYSSTMCPSIESGGARACKLGLQCPYAHHPAEQLFEAWLHPSRFRTQLCSAGSSCSRALCFFAHSPSELRVLAPPPPQQQHLPACTAGEPHLAAALCCQPPHAGSLGSSVVSGVTGLFSALGLGCSSSSNSSNSNSNSSNNNASALSMTSSSSGSWAMMVEPRSDSSTSIGSCLPAPAGSTKLVQPQPQAQLLMFSQPQQMLVPSQPQQMLLPSQPQQMLLPSQLQEVLLLSQPQQLLVSSRPQQLLVSSQPQQLLVPCDVVSNQSCGIWSAPSPVAPSANTPLPADLCYTSLPVAVIGLDQLTTLTTLPWL